MQQVKTTGDHPFGEAVRGLRTAPAGRGDATQFALIAIAFGAILLAPYAPLAGPVIPGMTGVFCGGMLVSELVTAYLLLGLFRVERSVSLLVLAAAYFFSALMAGAYLLTFPGALIPDAPLVGSSQTAAWIISAWLLGYGGLALAAVILEADPTTRPIPLAVVEQAIQRAATGVLGAVASIVMFALMAPADLLTLVDGARWTGLHRLANVAATALLAGAIGYGFVRLPRKSGVFSWLLVALAIAAASNLLAGIGGGRFTIGWTLAHCSAVIGGCLLLVFFIRQTADHRAALARARDRLEHNVAMRTAQLTGMVAERDHLLREVHHRVQNNLQTVDSLIHIQSAHEEPQTRATLAAMRRRLRTLAVVHRMIIATGAREPLDAAALVREVCAEFHETGAGVRFAPMNGPIPLDLERATPLALIAAELAGHAIDAARAPQTTLEVAITRAERELRLIVDAVNGDDDLWSALDGPSPRGQIIRALTTQAGGAIERPTSTALAIAFPVDRG